MSWVVVVTTGEPDSQLVRVVGPFDFAFDAQNYAKDLSPPEFGDVAELQETEEIGLMRVSKSWRRSGAQT